MSHAITRIWISGPDVEEVRASLADVGLGHGLSRDDVLQEFDERGAEAEVACCDTILAAHLVVYLDAPDSIEAVLADAAGIPVVSLTDVLSAVV